MASHVFGAKTRVRERVTVHMYDFIFRGFNLIFFSCNPKCYYALDRDSEKYKRSSKGIQDRIKLQYEDYKEVVYSHKKTEVENFSIRSHNGKMSTIKMTKTGMSNIFVKAFVQNDLVTICPFKKFIEP